MIGGLWLCSHVTCVSVLNSKITLLSNVTTRHFFRSFYLAIPLSECLTNDVLIGKLLNPWMFDGFFERNSLLGFFCQELHDEIPRQRWNVLRKLDGFVTNPSIRLFGFVRFERCATGEEFKHQNTNTPIVHLKEETMNRIGTSLFIICIEWQFRITHSLVILFPLNHLRRKVVLSAAKGFPATRWCVNTPTEIGDFQFIVNAQKKIFRLDITVGAEMWKMLGKWEDNTTPTTTNNNININNASVFRIERKTAQTLTGE